MTNLGTLAIWLTAGGMTGLIYFRLVRHSADLLLSRRRGGPWLGVALVLLRLGSLGGVLFIASMQGAGPLLSASLGLMIGRFTVMRSARGAV